MPRIYLLQLLQECGRCRLDLCPDIPCEVGGASWRTLPTAFLTAVVSVGLLGGLVSIGRADNARIDHEHPARPGGRLVVAQRTEPRTLNPLLALDIGSREVIGLM